jgi:hypothetical protein
VVRQPPPLRFWRATLIALVAAAAGCGTTRWTDTQRTATEQLLVTDAIDRAVNQISFRSLAGQTVFLDTQFLKLANPVLLNNDDPQYLVSSLRQHLLASGCIMKEKREDADYVVEARSGVLGTDRHDLLYGIPQTNLAGAPTVQGFGVPAAIPEIPLAKKTVQRGVAKIAVFAYHRETGRPIWQSGTSLVASNARNTWFFGVGPFQSGTIHDGTQFAGREIANPLANNQETDEDGPLWVTKEAYFEHPKVGETKPESKPQVSVAKEPKKPDAAPAKPAAFKEGPPVPTAKPKPQPSAARLPDVRTSDRGTRLWPY